MSARASLRISRRVCVLLAILPASILAQATPRAPIDRGSLLVAGGAALSRVREELGSGDSRTVRSVTHFSVQPNLLYFVAPRVAVGGQLGYSHVGGDGQHSATWGIGPAARVYFGDRHAKILPYTGVSGLREVNTVDTDLPAGSVEFRSWEYEAVGGLTWMVSPQVGLLGEGFVGRSTNDGGASAQLSNKTTAFGLRFGFAAFIL